MKAWAIKAWAICGSLVAVTACAPAFGAVYDVSHTFSNGVTAVVITGTITVPEGEYEIASGGIPFTNVNLNMQGGIWNYPLTNASDLFISGTGQFFVSATPTQLTFNTANTDGINGSADLLFGVPFSNTYLFIGSDGNPGFELGRSPNFNVIVGRSLPTVFGTVPEPTSLALLLPAACAVLRRRRRLPNHLR